MTQPGVQAPLAGVRVLDLSMVFSGPLTTALLGEQGADVIKVEAPEGDTSRRVGPAKGSLSAAFISANRGKRGLSLDLKLAAGLAVLRELVVQVDVLVENYRPGVMARLGLGRTELMALNPRLVHLSITGFGADGPYADGRAYDAVIQAVAGVAASQRDASTGDPVLLFTTVCDKLTALTAAQAVTAALFARERDGQGRHVEVAMLDATLAFQWTDGLYNQVFLEDPPAPFPEMGVMLKPWRTRDGFVAVMSPQADEFKALCAGLGVPALAADVRFASLAARVQNGVALRQLLAPLFAQRETAECVDALRKLGVPIGRINEHAAVVADPQVLHNGMVTEVQHGAAGKVRMLRGATRFNGQRGVPPTPAPALGEHSVAVLRELLGYDEERIRSLQASGALRCA